MVATPGMIFVRTLSQPSITIKAAYVLQPTAIRGGNFAPMITLVTDIYK